MDAKIDIPVSVNTHVYHGLEEYAASTGRTVSEAAEHILGRYLDIKPRLPQHQQQQQQHAPASAFQQQAQQPLQQEESAKSLASGDSFSRLDSRQLAALRQQSLVPLYVAAPIIRLVDGLLAGDHSVAECLAKGNFGLGTLNYLDGEVVIYGGVAYHQGPQGTKVLTGQERTPFMTVTTFNKAWCREFALPPLADLASLEAHLKQLFRSKNVIYALLVKGSFAHLKCRSVGKQEGHVRLADVAAAQVTFDYHDEQDGLLVGFYCPEYVGSSVNVPGFHFHFLSADRQRGGHLLAVEVSSGKVLLQEIHRTQLDLPFEEDFLQSDLDMGRVAADLDAAEKER